MPVGILASLNQIKVPKWRKRKEWIKDFFHYWTWGNMLTWRTVNYSISQMRVRWKNIRDVIYFSFSLTYKFTFKRLENRDGDRSTFWTQLDINIRLTYVTFYKSSYKKKYKRHNVSLSTNFKMCIIVWKRVFYLLDSMANNYNNILLWSPRKCSQQLNLQPSSGLVIFFGSAQICTDKTLTYNITCGAHL